MNNNKNQDGYWKTSGTRKKIGGVPSLTSTNVGLQIKHDSENEQVQFKSEDFHFNDFPLNSNLHAYDEAYFNYNKPENFMLEEEDVEADVNGYNNYYINDGSNYYQETEYNDVPVPSSSKNTKSKPLVRRGRKPNKNATTTPTKTTLSSGSSSKTSSRIFPCPFCSHIDSSQISNDSHLKTHIKGKCHAYTCSLCPSASKKQHKIFSTIHEWLLHVKKCHLKGPTIKICPPEKLRTNSTSKYKSIKKKKDANTAGNHSQLKDSVQTNQNDESGRRSKRLKQKPRIKFNLLVKGKIKLSSLTQKSDNIQDKIQPSQKLNIKKKEQVVSQPVFKCREKDCNASFSTFASRKKHEESYHVKVHCPMPDCLSVFNVISALRNHMLHEHDIELPPEFESEIQEEEQRQPQRQRVSTSSVSKPEIKTTTTTTNINSKPYPRVKEVSQRSPFSSPISKHSNAQSATSTCKSGKQNFIVIVTPMKK